MVDVRVDVAIGLLLLFLTYRYILAPAFITPLSKIPPAHPTTPFLPLWPWYQRLRRRETLSICAAHRRLGPLVRLGPSEISVNSLDGLRAIYRGGFERDGWYAQFANFGTPNLISTRDHRSHAQLKRCISNVYSKSYLHGSGDLQRLSRVVLVGRFLPLVQRKAAAGLAVEVLELAKCVSMDMIAGYIFGSASGFDFLEGGDGYRATWFGAYEAFKVQSPRQRAGSEVERSCLAMCEAAEAALGAGKDSAALTEGTRPVVYEELSRRLDASEKGTSSRSRMTAVASELLDHLIAGHESSGITVTYVLYEMSLHPELQLRLREEVLSLEPTLSLDADDMPKPSSIDSLPLLDAIVQETLRLHQAVVGPQPRITPYATPPVNIDGYSIPRGTRVSSNAHTLHRDPAVFPDCEAWTPDRWLEADESLLREMKRWFWAFGSGGRMCLGSHFAVLNIKKVVAAIYTNFDTTVLDATGIEQEDGYVAGPVGNKLILRFHNVSKDR